VPSAPVDLREIAEQVLKTCRLFFVGGAKSFADAQRFHKKVAGRPARDLLQLLCLNIGDKANNAAAF